MLETDRFRELYDLETDPHETHNLAGDAGQETRVAEMGRRLARLRAEIAEPRIPEPPKPRT